MFIHSEITYGFLMPQEYNELKQFESNHDVSNARRSEDTIAIRYTFTNDYFGEYGEKEKTVFVTNKKE